MTVFSAAPPAATDRLAVVQKPTLEISSTAGLEPEDTSANTPLTGLTFSWNVDHTVIRCQLTAAGLAV